MMKQGAKKASRFSGWIAEFRSARRTMRGSTALVLAGFACYWYQPVVEAQQQPKQERVRLEQELSEAQTFPPTQPEFDLSLALSRTLEKVEGWRQSKDLLARSLSNDDVGQLRRELSSLDLQALTGFEQVASFIESRGLPPEIRQRHQDMVAAFSGRILQVQTLLNAIAEGGSPDAKAAAVDSLATLLEAQGNASPHQPLDPNQLPVRTARAEKRAPASSPRELHNLLADRADSAKSRARLSAELNARALPPQPADLQPNPEVQIGPEIQALAASLGGDALAIFNWVHDNIEFVPTYGSVQGSRMTLEARRGNAFDIASLQVALLRASNIPARFVLGNVQVPVNSVLNWLGGVQDARVAQKLLGVGGIPNVGLVSGNQTTHIRIEHVWVEAWLDYLPGRGAKSGNGDTWVPLDASFKQHDFEAERGILANAPIDLSATWDGIIQAGQYDPVLERASGLNLDVMFAALSSYQQDAQSYASANGIPPTRNSLLGAKTIRPSGLGVLPSSLPYQVLSRNAVVSTFPEALRPSVELNGFASSFERALGDPAFTYRISLPELNSRRLSFTFPPATEVDAQTLAAAQQSGASSLPIYLINVAPTVTLDGIPVVLGNAVRMGSTYFVDVTLRDTDGRETLAYQVTAGDESVFGVNGNGIVESVLTQRLSRVPSNTTAENMQQVALHYWMESDYLDTLAAAGLKVHSVRRLSVGRFAAPLTASYFFGVPRSGVYQSRIMDVKRSLIGAAGPDDERERAFVRTSGLQGSFLEGSVLDQLYQRSLNAGVSAVQLFQDAVFGGIPIYHVTPSNLSLVLPLLQVPSAVRSDIVNAIHAGKTVLVPERDLVKDNYRGIGYIVEDPVTGAAAYLISGGLNGGGIFDCLPDLVPIIIFILVVILIALLLWWFWPAIAAGLAGAGAAVPALARAVAALVAMIVGTAPAYAAGGTQGGPCRCPPPPPPPPCEVDLVPPSRQHWPCTGPIHWHYRVYNQRPFPDCTNFLSGRLFGGCGPPPVPCPP